MCPWDQDVERAHICEEDDDAVAAIWADRLKWMWRAGFVMGVLAAVFAAVAFFVISCIPKSEPALVLSLWFHAASIAMSVVPLMVRLIFASFFQALYIC